MGVTLRVFLGLLTSFALGMSLVPTVAAQPGWVKQAMQRAEGFQPHDEASTLVLHNVAAVSISDKGAIKRKVQYAEKILTKAGAENAGLKVQITSTRKVKNLKGWLIKPTGKKIKLEKKSIVEVDLDHAAGYYDDDRSLVAGFRDVCPGDVVVYEYEINEKDPWTGYYQAFVFQVSEPVVWAQFELKIPNGWLLHTSTQYMEPIKLTELDNRYIWTANHLTYRPVEPYMPAWSRLIRRVSVGCYDPKPGRAHSHADWQSVAQWVNRLHLGACASDDKIRGQVDQVCSGLSTPAEKLQAIAAFVRDEIRYVAVEIGAGRLQPRAASATFFNKYGDCKDKATLMRSMLAAVGIQSEAVLALVGRPVDPEYPSPFQFNHVIIGIDLETVPNWPASPESVVDGWLFFDPTSESTRLGMLPASLRGAYLLRTSPSDTGVCLTPSLVPTDKRRCYRAEAKLRPDHSMTADVTVTDYGLWGGDSEYYYRTTSVADLTDRWQKRFSDMMQNPTLSNLATGTGADSAWISFRLEGEGLVSVAGDFLMLKTDIFHADLPNNLTDTERLHPITFGSPDEYVTCVNWRLPEGWSVDGTPESFVDTCHLAAIDSRTVVDTTVQLDTRVTYFGGNLEPDRYREARTFNKSIRAAYRTRTFLKISGD